MKTGLHPNYTEATITCACGNVMKTNSTKADMKVDVCSKCHPFWTGNLKRETTGGRADKFKKKSVNWEKQMNKIFSDYTVERVPKSIVNEGRNTVQRMLYGDINYRVTSNS